MERMKDREERMGRRGGHFKKKEIAGGKQAGNAERK